MAVRGYVAMHDACPAPSYIVSFNGEDRGAEFVGCLANRNLVKGTNRSGQKLASRYSTGVSKAYDFIGSTWRGPETVPVMAASNCSSLTGLDSTGACLKRSGNPARP